MHVPISRHTFMYLPPLSLAFCQTPALHLSQSLLFLHSQMETQNSEMIRKRRFPTSYIYANNKILAATNREQEESKLTGDNGVLLDRSSPAPKVEIETEAKNHRRYVLKPTHDFDEIKQSLTISKELVRLLMHIWSQDHHPVTFSLTSTLNNELNKVQSRVNRLIQEQRSNGTMTCEESKEHGKVKSIARELEIERKLRRQTERLNKKLGQELANTKSSLLKAESETEILEKLCKKMGHDMEEDRMEIQELKRESKRVSEEMEEEREMLRVADMLREERVYMKLCDAKYEYEAQVNMITRDLEELLEVDNNTMHLKKEKTRRSLLWYEKKGEAVVNEETMYNSDSIEFECMKNESEEEEVSYENEKEYEDEMERYKMIKDLRDRIVSASDHSPV